MIEIERKFILRDAAVINELKARDIDVQQKEVTQIYIKITPLEEIRFREASGVFTITQKSGVGLAREENESETDAKSFKKALKNAVAAPIKKTRFLFRLDGAVCNVDIFHGALEGLVTFEAEFSDEREAAEFSLPEFIAAHIVSEVTEDERYKNKNLALFGLPQGSFDAQKSIEILQNSPELELNLPSYIGAMDAMRTVFFQIFTALNKHLNEYASSGDAEALHQIRINLRKTRSLLKIFTPVFDRKTACYFLLNFKKLAELTNQKRDIDVFCEFLQKQKGFESLASELEILSKTLAQSVQAELELQSDEANEILRDWEVFLREGSDFFKGELGDAPIKKLAAKSMRAQILRLKKSLSNLSETTENAQFHKCRIEIKRLRYLSEIFGGGFDFAAAKKCFKKSKILQGTFGSLQDADIWLGLLAHVKSGAEQKRIDKLQAKIYKKIYELRSEILDSKPKILKSLTKLSRGLKIYYI
ncbi:CHAD domain-containing protein [Campylobacter showae]|uniref:CHAD domain-contain protein n=1 Tax=Campylobacter showae CC57C TaxID=1073353 RepID=M3IKD2_9BACT|nr:CHAD domain-containing protein [Campylobacter showae]EMG30526.1 CHAD domain-contain protein [Campylobacter showae CC57C]